MLTIFGISMVYIYIFLAFLFLQKWYIGIFGVFCFVSTLPFIHLLYEELFMIVTIRDGKIYISYDRKHKSDMIIDCEYSCNQIIEGNIRGDILTLKYDQRHFISLNERQWDNYDALLFYIVDNKIKVTTNYPDEFSKLKKKIVNNTRLNNSIKADNNVDTKIGIRERILILLLSCSYGGFGCFIIFRVISDGAISYKSIIAVIFGVLLLLMSIVSPSIIKKKL